jgi:2-polyprenyl-3-methyl-5-hydroxy-6-metoxy-1,4-benzoquinol methylase
MNDHDQNLARAFDSQAPQFERAPVQSDPIALKKLVQDADLPSGGLVLDAGCGPGLVSAALLDAGFRVVGVDLSREMIERAHRRCAAHGARAQFAQVSVFDGQLNTLGPFDGSLSRYVLHHVVDPQAFVIRQVELLRPGGVLVVNDHLTDLDPGRAEHHRILEWSRDHTHTRSLTGGDIVDLFAAAGLAEIRLMEETYALDFDEWFDRGTPVDTKESVRDSLLTGPRVRGFVPELQPDGSIRIEGIRAIVRGVKTYPGSIPTDCGSHCGTPPD